MTDVYILAIDLAKRRSQVRATAPGGAVLFNRVVSRAKLETVLREQSPCIVTMEACARANHLRSLCPPRRRWFCLTGLASYCRATRRLTRPLRGLQNVKAAVEKQIISPFEDDYAAQLTAARVTVLDDG